MKLERSILLAELHLFQENMNSFYEANKMFVALLTTMLCVYDV